MKKTIALFAYLSLTDGGSFQYGLSLTEAFTKNLPQYRYILLKKDEFPSYSCKYINLGEGTSFVEKVKILIQILTGIDMTKFQYFIPQKTYEEIDLIISPMLSLIPLYLKKPYILTMHDFQHKYFPEFFSKKERLIRDFMFKKAAEKATYIVCESNYVKKDIVKFLKISEKKIKILTSPPPDIFKLTNYNKNIQEQIQKKYHLDNFFLYYPAQFWKHKNHENLLKALKFIKDKYKKNICLVMSGSDKGNLNFIKNLSLKLGINNQIYFLGFIPQEEIPYIYKLSKIVVIPSLFESVSMPIWEAYQVGVPVVASQICALPEQIGDTRLLFNPHDYKDMAEKIYRLWNDKNLQKKSVQKGKKRIIDFTLRNYAKQWQTLISDVLE